MQKQLFLHNRFSFRTTSPHLVKHFNSVRIQNPSLWCADLVQAFSRNFSTRSRRLPQKGFMCRAAHSFIIEGMQCPEGADSWQFCISQNSFIQFLRGCHVWNLCVSEWRFSHVKGISHLSYALEFAIFTTTHISELFFYSSIMGPNTYQNAFQSTKLDTTKLSP